MATVPKTCKVILANTIAERLLKEVQNTLQAIGNDKPKLAAFLANDDPAAVQYAEWSQKTCEEKSAAFHLPPGVLQDLLASVLTWSWLT